MRSFFSKSGPSTTQEPLDLAQLAAVIKNFPFGAAVRYYPEFKKSIVLESVMLGYVLDKKWYFSAQDIAFEGEGSTTRMLEGPHRKAANPSTFSMVIPSQSRGIAQLDYARKEELERTGGLAKGNNITLVAAPHNGKTAVIETVVRRKTIVPEGPYANTPVVLLDVDASSLQRVDQRANMRLQTNIPAQLMTSKSPPTPCLMVDFSDRSVRLSVVVAWATTMQARREVTLSFQLPGRNNDVVLRGEIQRRDDDELVITLEAIQRDNQFQRIEVIDILEIKAKLLQLPETSV